MIADSNQPLLHRPEECLFSSEWCQMVLRQVTDSGSGAVSQFKVEGPFNTQPVLHVK